MNAFRPGPQADGDLYYGLREVQNDNQLPDVGQCLYVWFSAQAPFAQGFYRATQRG